MLHGSVLLSASNILLYYRFLDPNNLATLMSNSQHVWNACNSAKQLCAQCISFQAPTSVVAPSVASYLDAAVSHVTILIFDFSN